MKKWLALTLLLFCIPALVWGWGTVIISGSVPTNGTDPCAPLGDYELYYDVDHTSGTDVACISGGTSTGTIVGATVSSTQNHTTGGTYSLLVGGNDEYIDFPRDSLISSSEGYVKIWFYPTATDEQFTLFEMRHDSGNFIHLSYSGGGTFNLWYIGNDGGSSQYNQYTATPTANAWNYVEIRWSVANSLLDISVNGGTWDSDSDAIAAFSTEASTFRFGECSSGRYGSADVYIDDCYISSTYTP